MRSLLRKIGFSLGEDHWEQREQRGQRGQRGQKR